jgi:hypothetical protein
MFPEIIESGNPSKPPGTRVMIDLLWKKGMP